MKILACSLSLLFASSVWAGQIRNFKPVVDGSIYRAGTTNKAEYSDATLHDLCEQGFTLGIFLYKGAHKRTVSCSGGKSITYMSIATFQKVDSVIGPIRSSVNGGGKVVFHCWNGVHATGFIAAASLNQFCGFSGAQAEKYFRDGVPAGSLPVSNINKLAAILSALPTGRSSLQGCPSPR
jgi:hypothetical protein